MTTGRAWVLLKSGRRLDLLDPHPHSWSDEDIATGLSRTYRWGGHSQWDHPLSVAQHSLTVLHLRQLTAGHTLSAAEQLRELAHDMDEGLLGFDAITPLRPHFGDGYEKVVKRLRQAINTRYDLLPWDRDSHADHKRADRLAASSEALHVVGWSPADIRFSLGIAVAPLADDPVPIPPGMRPWQPWPPSLAANLFLERLHDLQRQIYDLPVDHELAVIDPTHHANEPSPGVLDPPTFVLVEGGGQTVEGQVVKGVRDGDGSWDFDGVFTVQTEDGELLKVHGWNCLTEVL